MTHTATQIAGQVTPNISGPVMEDLWIELMGSTTLSSWSPATPPARQQSPLTVSGRQPRVAKRSRSYFSYKSGSYGSEGGPPLRSFSLAGRNSKVAVVDYTQVRTPSSTGASYLSYTQMPATYPFWAFATVLEFPMDPYVIKRHSCCLLSGRALA